MQSYAEILPPTAVTHSIALPFLDAKSRNLAVAKTNLLQLFEYVSAASQPKLHTAGSVNGAGTADAHLGAVSGRLQIVAEYPLSGNITSLGTIKLPNSRSGGFGLLIATDYAKISLVEWDPESHHVATVSIHYYEGDQLPGGSTWAPEPSKFPSYLAVDPNNRCIALKFGQRNLAIVPFRQAEDDLVEEDYDPDLDGPAHPPHEESRHNGVIDGRQRPYAPSFVLPLTALDSAILFPIHLAFLYEYREPTIGILSSAVDPTSALGRFDVINYTAFTLDLEQKARTPLLSVSGLPSDLEKIVPLPLPVGGSLLIGANELVHVDQAGKIHAIGVNEFSKQASKFPMADSSSLGLRLESCAVAPLATSNGDLFLALSDGSLAIVTFRMDGRTVSGLRVRKILSANGGNCLGATPTCATTIAPSIVFLGSEDADAVVISCTSRAPATTARKRSHAHTLAGNEDEDGEDEDEDEDEGDDDDLYGGNDASNTTSSTKALSSLANINDLTVSVLDRLPNLAAQTEPAIAKSHIGDASHLEIGLSTGRGLSGGVSVLKRGTALVHHQNLNFNNVQRAWSIKAVTKDKKVPTWDPSNQCDNLLILSYRSDEGDETSSIYTVTDERFERRDDCDFDVDSATIAVDTLQNGSRIVQVLKSELKCYDPALDFPQIIPMIDEDTEVELSIVHQSFAETFLMVIRDDLSAIILQANAKGELEELDREGILTTTQWISGSLYEYTPSETFAAILSVDGTIYIFRLPDISHPVVKFDAFPHLPLFIAPDYHARRMEAKATLKEIILTSFDGSKSDELYLLIRTETEEITAYKAYQYPVTDADTIINSQLRWRKWATFLPPSDFDWDDSTGSIEKPFASQKMQQMRIGEDLTAVRVAGRPLRFIVKKATSLPMAFQILGEDIKDVSPMDSSASRHGLLLIGGTGRIKTTSLPRPLEFPGNGWTSRSFQTGGDIDAIDFHSPSGLYALGVNENVPFRLPEDDWHPEWAKEPDYVLKPSVPDGSIQLFNADHMVFLDAYRFAKEEAVLSVKAINLEVSEKTHERKTVIAVGTTQIRGEDNVSMGVIYIFEVVDVVPEPGRPETHWKLKRVSREEMRGAVTAISEIGTQGFLVHAQGQRCMVRGLKEDNSVLPIAFQDVQMYVTVLRNLKGSGFALVGDAVKGLWFVGFSPDPYRMLHFGKSRSGIDVASAEFLPDHKQLYIVVADIDSNLHVLEYNPEHPQSLAGQRLLFKSTFHAGHLPCSLNLLSSTLPSAALADADGDSAMRDPQDASASLSADNHVLLTTRTGALGMITSLDESTYRRLGALQAHLSNVLDHVGSLNPRAYRAVEAEGGGRGMLDGNILMRWAELGSQRKQESLTRAGSERWEVVRDLGMIAGEGAACV